MVKKTLKKEKKAERPKKTASLLPLVDGVQAIEVIRENETAIHYRLANGTTAWVSKK